MRLNTEQIGQYLKRIGATGAVEPNLASLRQIQERHMLSVPFENLDVAHHLPVRLDEASLYNKIVARKRGGYCYELNGLLASVLRKLGYDVSMVSGQVRRDDGTFGPEFDHMALLVRLDEDYLVDVGFGDSVRSPLALSGVVVVDVSGSYRIAPDEGADAFSLQKQVDGTWLSQYRFTLYPRQLEDFHEMNLYQQTSVDSHFTKNLIVSIATPEGRLSISGDTFIETVGGKKSRRVIAEAERGEWLQRHFGITLPAP